jgi:hypothetical protein
VWGNGDAALELLEQLRIATREPGCDDDESKSPEDAGTEPDTCPPPEPDSEQLSKEVMTDDEGEFANDALKLLAIMQGGVGPPDKGGGSSGSPDT